MESSGRADRLRAQSEQRRAVVVGADATGKKLYKKLRKSNMFIRVVFIRVVVFVLGFWCATRINDYADVKMFEESTTRINATRINVYFFYRDFLYWECILGLA